MRCQFPPVKGLLTLIGSILIQFSLGTTYLFANFTPYITSYLRNRTSSVNVDYSQTTWISTSYLIAGSVFTPILGLLETRLHFRVMLIFGCLLYTGGVSLTYYTIQSSLLPTIMTYGVMFGIGKGLAYPASLKASLKWFPRHSSIISGLLNMGYGLSSFVFNMVITAYINPDNYSVKIMHGGVKGDDKYFDQKKLLDRVPYSFLVLGGIVASLQIIGMFLLREPPHNTETLQIQDEKHRADADVYMKSMTVKEVLKCKMFYLMWFMMLTFSIGSAFTVATYKTYGQTFITNDHYLSTVASVSSIFNAAGGLIWGLIADRIGQQPAMLGITSLFAGFLATLVFSEQLGHVYFFIWVCALLSMISGFFSVVPAIILQIYGPKNYVTIFGLQFTDDAVSGVVTSLITTNCKPYLSWNGLILLIAGLVAISFVLSIVIDIIQRIQKRNEEKEVTERLPDELTPVLQSSIEYRGHIDSMWSTHQSPFSWWWHIY